MPALNVKACELQEIRHIPLSYDSANSHDSALHLCLALFPEWGTSEGEVEFIHFKDGITNTLLKAIKKRPAHNEEQIEEEAVLIRAYGNGTEILIDRQRELRAHLLLAQHGLAPPLFARFQNGLIYRFVRGEPCTPADLRKEPIWRGVARKLAEWHSLLPIGSARSAAVVKDNVEISLGTSPPATGAPKEIISTITPRKPTPNIWTVMAKWLLALPTTNATEVERRDKLQKEVKRTAAELGDTPGLGGNGLIFAHCDLLSGNVIVEPKTRTNGSTPKHNIRSESVNFIDYEYATPAPVAFDLANHFAEWGGFDCDYGALPTRSTRRAFISEYVTSFDKFSPLVEHSKDTYVDRLFQEVDLFRGIPGLYWGIWALIQADISQIDFDYASYAETRLQEYWSWRAAHDKGRPIENGARPLRERRWAEE